MAPLDALNEGLYDEVATQITYCKLFPLIMEDFLTRSDCKDIMTATNLIVNTTIAGSVSGPGNVTGTGLGVVNAKYAGNTPNPGTMVLRSEKQALQDAGGVSGQVIGSLD